MSSIDEKTNKFLATYPTRQEEIYIKIHLDAKIVLALVKLGRRVDAEINSNGASQFDNFRKKAAYCLTNKFMQDRRKQLWGDLWEDWISMFETTE